MDAKLTPLEVLLSNEIKALVTVLEAIDHTLAVHGHIDADTDLHRRIRDQLERTK